MIEIKKIAVEIANQRKEHEKLMLKNKAIENSRKRLNRDAENDLD
jgi:hypothetical protein